MNNKTLYIVLISILSVSVSFSFAQKESNTAETAKTIPLLKVKDTVIEKEIDPLRPSKAAFYSAVLPGLGQAYNKKYWKIPIFLGGVTGGILVYNWNNNNYKEVRNAYKRRLAGFTDDRFYGEGSTPNISNDALIRAQQQYRRNKELTLLVTIGIYALNIVDANVDAHLLQFNVDENLSLRPHFKYNEMENASDLGMTLNFKF